MTSNDFDQELQNRLQSLNSDLTGSRLPGPSAARKRAAQRTRRQVTSTALAGVAAVAVATVIIFRPSLPSPDDAPPAITPSETETNTQQPTNTPTPTTDASIPDNALLTTEDIWSSDGSGPNWTQVASDERPECFPELAAVDPDQQAQVHFSTDPSTEGRLHVTHDVLLLPSETASAAFADLVSQVEDCVPNSERDSRGGIITPYQLARGPVQNVADEAYLFEYITDYAANPDLGWFVDVGIARHNDLVSIVARWYAGQDKIQEGDYRTLAAATDRMCQAIEGQSCLDGEPAYRPETPQSQGSGEAFSLAEDPFLTTDDVNPVGAYGDGFELIENPPADAYAQELAWKCLDDIDEIGAVAWDHRAWGKGPEGTIDNAAIQFSGIPEADNWILDYTVLEDRCANLGALFEYSELDQIGVIDVDGADDAIAWSISNNPPNQDSSFTGVGIARRENIGVVVSFSSLGDPGNWEEYVTERLAEALERAAGPSPQ